MRWGAVLARRGPGDEDTAQAVVELLLLQAEAAVGLEQLQPSQQYVYMTMLESHVYVGRTHCSHESRTSMGGLAIRREQHQNEVVAQFSTGVAPSRARSRYKKFLKNTKTLFMYSCCCRNF